MAMALELGTKWAFRVGVLQKANLDMAMNGLYFIECVPPLALSEPAPSPVSYSLSSAKIVLKWIESPGGL